MDRPQERRGFMNELGSKGITPPVKKPRRKRRSTQEIFDRIIDAAFLEFGENGFSNTTTLAIARRAEVAEALIFTHFGSKANLFRKAVFKPLDDHFSTFMATHTFEDRDKARHLRESREFVSDLAGFVRRHSGIFKSLVVSEAYAKDDDGASGLRGLQDYFNKMSAIEEVRLTGRPKVAPRVISRISFAAILGCILFNDWLFPEGVAEDKEVHDGLCDFIMEGLGVNPNMRSRSTTR
jgi:AcrR family transcriptional regulator